MGALSLLPLSISNLSMLHRPPSLPAFSNSFSSTKPTCKNPCFTRFSSAQTSLLHESIVPRSNQNDANESLFLDEDGIVDDMDGYLNYLSLEYDSVWDTKPAWCQPWTILLSGVMVVASSWLFVHSVVVTTVILFLICAWWYIFLYTYPKAYSDMIAERRKKIRSGIEDTFGVSKSQ